MLLQGESRGKRAITPGGSGRDVLWKGNERRALVVLSLSFARAAQDCLISCNAREYDERGRSRVLSSASKGETVRMVCLSRRTHCVCQSRLTGSQAAYFFEVLNQEGNERGRTSLICYSVKWERISFNISFAIF